MSASTSLAEDVGRFLERHLIIGVRTGDEWMCTCPFHEETHPSMSVNVAKGVFVCFACGAKGHVNRIAQHLGVEGFGITASDEVALASQITRALDVFDQSQRSVQVMPTVALEPFYLDRGLWYWVGERGLSEDTVVGFGLGFDLIENAAVVPMHDIVGNLLAVSRRYIDHSEYRWKYPRARYKKSHNLYLGHECWHQETIVVTEGQVDALKVWDAGFPAVALCGSSVSVQQVELLRRLAPERIVSMFDNDDAGRRGHAQLREMVTWDRVRRAQYSSPDPGSASVEEIEESVQYA